MEDLQHAPLGQETVYVQEYQPDLLFPIERSRGRSLLQLEGELPFFGVDIWNAFELSWLNAKGKPEVRIAEFYFPVDSACLVESKSFKLYLNSFNQTKFDSAQAVSERLRADLSQAIGADAAVNLIEPKDFQQQTIGELSGRCLDDLDIEVVHYEPLASLLQVGKEQVTETVYSNLLRSNCPVTGQPDWGSVQIDYQGSKIDEASLLAYLISYRQHQGFHEQCVEQIFVDIMRQCQPEKLAVFARYTRRGGLDINPYRTNYPVDIVNQRLARQ